LVLLAADLHALSLWLPSVLLPRAQAQAQAQNQAKDAAAAAVSAVVDMQTRRLDGTRVAVWAKLCQVLGAECRRNLQAVKAVAGKYRMTNKPPPDAASQYVESILAPLRCVRASPSIPFFFSPLSLTPVLNLFHPTTDSL
jgi:hypothetical protein